MSAAAARVVYTGFWRRVAAALVDSLFFVTVGVGVLLLIYGPGYFEWVLSPEGEWEPGSGANVLVEHVLPALITLWMWLRFGATPGKFLMGCRVVDAQTLAPIGLRQAVLRYVGYLLSLLPLGLGFIWVAIDKRRQGFHDKIARTVVIMDDEGAKSLEQLQREAGL